MNKVSNRSSTRLFVRHLALALVCGLLVSSALHAADSARAGGLMRNRQYNDAIKILVDTVKEKSESEGARDNLMLGECYYLIGKYNDALPCFTKAARNCTSDKDKATAEFRLACTAYYRKDFQDASARITAFSTQFPADARIGKLKVYKLSLIHI